MTTFSEKGRDGALRRPRTPQRGVPTNQNFLMQKINRGLRG